MGISETYHDKLRFETERSLEEWRHELLTHLDNKLFVTDNPSIVKSNDLRMGEIALRIVKQKRHEDLRQYVSTKSEQIPDGPQMGDPIRVSGRSYWYRYDAARKDYVDDLIPVDYTLTGHYSGCDILPYVAPYYLEGDNALARAEHREKRALGVHMMLTVPVMVRNDGEAARWIEGVDRVFVPLHYLDARFHVRQPAV